MAFNYEYPYCDTGRYNSDWLLHQYLELKNWIDNTATESIQKFINEQLGNLMIEATYNADTETLIFSENYA